ncbi:MAG: cupin-like domain-containing protein [Myxococcaceae bacterium]
MPRIPPLPFKATEVPRLHQPDAEVVWSPDFDVPAILTGCMTDWKLLDEMEASGSHEAKVAALSRLFGAQEIRFSTLPKESGGNHDYRDPQMRAEIVDFPDQSSPFDAFAQRLLRSLNGASDEYVYMRSFRPPVDSPVRSAMGRDVLPFLSGREPTRGVWIGSEGQVVNLHYDDFHNFICVASGVKRVTMFHPGLLRYMYHAPFDRMVSSVCHSHVRLLDPDLHRFPMFEAALSEAHVATVKAGEVLFMPPYWWHHVESFDLSVMVNSWVLLAPIDIYDQLYEHLTGAIKLFARIDPGQRRAQQIVYAREVFSYPQPAAPTAGHGDDVLSKHLRETREFVAKLPRPVRAQLERYYDQFVFQVHGEPFPAQPGEFAAMVERNASESTYFKR